jgi:hypothetical protein
MTRFINVRNSVPRRIRREDQLVLAFIEFASRTTIERLEEIVLRLGWASAFETVEGRPFVPRRKNCARGRTVVVIIEVVEVV